MWLFLPLAAGLMLDSTSFSSPFFPDHSRKFYMLGSAIPLRSGVRLVPPTSRKAGAMVGLSPIPAREVTVEVTCSHAGLVKAEDDGALTLWFSPAYARHVAVGNFYGVSPKIEGVLVVYDYRKGLFGYEKTGEVTLEELGRDYYCALSPSSTFALLLTFTGASLSVSYAQNNATVHCFTMPVSSVPERFLGISAFSGYPCQRGAEIVALRTTLLLTEQRFVEQMAASNTELEGLITSIQACTLPRLQREDLDTSLRELEGRVGKAAERVRQWQWKDLLDREKSALTYVQALESALSALEVHIQTFTSSTSAFNLASIVEHTSQQEVVGNDQRISSLVKQVQQEVRWYENVVRQTDGELWVYGGMAAAVCLGVYVYGSYVRAKKRHDI